MKKIRKDVWTVKEDEIIKTQWVNLPMAELLKLLPNRTHSGIERRITMLGLGGLKNRWKPEEDELIKLHWIKHSPEEMRAFLPKRTANAIELRASAIGLAGQKSGLYLWTEQEVSDLKRLWGKVKREEVYATIPNRAPESIQVKASSIGLEGNASLAHQVYTRDETFFDIPNILNSYYAGWIASDGSIIPISQNKVRVEISLQDRDVDMLIGFKNATKYTGPVQDLEASEPRCIMPDQKESVCRPQKRLQILCKPWADNLLRHWNIIPNKSLTYIGPNSSTFENDAAFILGYIEGDGFISVRSLNEKRVVYMGVCGGSKPALKFIQDFFDKHFPSTRYAEIGLDRDKTYRYHIAGDRAIAILRRLHALPVPHLKRKWQNPELLALLYPENIAQTHKSAILLV